ncbi:MAG: formylglycine-generating enzyme family protein [Candidatus Latescibacterota bacterium]
MTFIHEADSNITFSALTDSGGFCTIDIPKTSVWEDTPYAFSLGQNYPNPFNPSTVIPFSVSRGTEVKLSVYNVLGQYVRTLGEGYYSTGFHRAFWDGRDEYGIGVSAGVYVYVLSLERETLTGKMLLIDGSSRRTVTPKHSGSPEVIRLFKPGAETYKVVITAPDITPYEKAGISLIDGNTFEFVVSRKAVAITFAPIPAGTFMMGDEAGDLPGDTRPAHTVTLTGFEMSVHEVTNAQYAQFLNEALKAGTIAASSTSVKGAKGAFSGQEYVYLAGAEPSAPDARCWITFSNNTFGAESGYENWPLIWVTWYGAKAFALSYGYDLPTEAEWEYACRGGKQYKYGTDDGTLSTGKANYSDSKINHPVDVGSYPPNPYGLHEICGNVWEWCHDWYGPYPADSVSNPTGPETGSYRTIRGGGWSYYLTGSRSAFRYTPKPAYRYYSLGFRVVRRTSSLSY